MTTAEFIIGHSADDADERKQEMRKVFWALLVAVVIHLLIGYSLAVYGGYLYSPFTVAEEDKPVELSFVDLSATPAPTRMPFVENTPSKQSAEPQKKDFESNANSKAASELPPSGQANLPSQKGQDRPGMDFETKDYVPAIDGAQPQPSISAPSPIPEATAQPTPLTKEGDLALLTSTPQPKQQQPRVAKPGQQYQRALRKVRVSGNVANPGRTSVNATETALGKYIKVVWNLIVMQASNYFDSRGENSAFGSVEIDFVIQPDGRVQKTDVTVAKNTSNQVFLSIMLQAIMDSHLPPIPPEVLNTYPEGFEFDAGFDYIPDDAVRVPR